MRTLDARFAVIGTGSMGSQIAWRLAARGEDVVALESATPGHDRCAVGGDTRLFRLVYREGATYTDLLQLSLEMWTRLADEGHAALQQCGGLSIGHPDEPYMIAMRKAAADTGLPHELLDHDELAARYPQHALLPTDVGLLDPQAGFLRTDVAVQGAAALAAARGAEVRANTPVREIVSHEGWVEVVTDAGSVAVERAVVAGGAFTPAVLPELAGTLGAIRIPLSWFAAEDAAAFSPERFPIFVRESGGEHIYGLGSIDGNTVKIGGLDGGHHGGQTEDPAGIARDLHPDEAAHLSRLAADFFVGLRPGPVRADCYPDLYSPDGNAFVGPMAGRPGVTVVSGFSGRGFKMSAGVGEAVARMLLDEPDALDLGFLSPSRYGF